MEFITQPLVLMFVVSTMFSVGLMVKLSEIAQSIRSKALISRALLANFVMLPVLAYTVSRAFQLDPALTAGLMILATAPGGPVLIKLVLFAKGNPALAVALLVTLSLLAVITQPLVLPSLLDNVRVSAEEIIFTLVTTVMTPLLIALGVRAKRADWAARLELPVQRLSSLSVLLICILLPAQHWQALVEISSSGAFPAAALFLTLAAIGGWLMGGPQTETRRILSLNCSQPNLAVAVVIASHNFSDPRVVLMLLVVMLCSIVLMPPLCLFYAKQNSA